MRIKIFISSVQKELADERLALQILLTTDPFLSKHCVPVLFDLEPSPLRPDPQAYLKVLEGCQVYLGMIWKEYGRELEGYSATHHEYQTAQKLKLSTLMLVKGASTLKRHPRTDEFFKAILHDGHTYDRFKDSEELQSKVRARLVRHIRENFDVEPSADQTRSAEQTIHAASPFERQRLDSVLWAELDHEIARELAMADAEPGNRHVPVDAVSASLRKRGYLWRTEGNDDYATAAGILLMAPNPSEVFPHTRIQAAAHPGTVRDTRPLDHETIARPLPIAIDDAVAFVERNTRHPLRVIGLKRITVDEYPVEALREALVNALAHRDYEDASRKITLDVFADRIEIVSPGGLVGNLTLSRFRSGRARSRSRNPGIAQALTLLGRMEERGTGIQRMSDAMLDHGLDKPVLTVVDGEVIVTLTGPGDEIDRIRIPRNMESGLSPATEAKINERQKAILEEAIKTGQVTTKWCKETFNVVQDTAARDLKGLVDFKLLKSQGKGRGTHYVPAP